MSIARAWGGLIEQYRERLPVGPNEKIVTLNEGNTPLVRADRLAAVVAPGIELYGRIWRGLGASIGAGWTLRARSVAAGVQLKTAVSYQW